MKLATDGDSRTSKLINICSIHSMTHKSIYPNGYIGTHKLFHNFTFICTVHTCNLVLLFPTFLSYYPLPSSPLS